MVQFFWPPKGQSGQKMLFKKGTFCNFLPFLGLTSNAHVEWFLIPFHSVQPLAGPSLGIGFSLSLSVSLSVSDPLLLNSDSDQGWIWWPLRQFLGPLGRLGVSTWVAGGLHGGWGATLGDQNLNGTKCILDLRFFTLTSWPIVQSFF